MPKADPKEPFVVQVQRLRVAVADVMMAVSDLLYEIGHRHKVLAQREILQWHVEARWHDDEGGPDAAA